MPTIRLPEVELHYRATGEGPPLVLLHGLSGDMGSWSPAFVAQLALDHRLIVVDLRGHGASGMPPSGYTTRDHADDLAALLTALKIERAALLGHSYGGAVALHFAAVHGERLRALVVADARVRALQPAQGVREWAHWDRVHEWFLRNGMDAIDADTLDPDLGVLELLARCRLEGKLDSLEVPGFFVPFASGSPRRAQRWLELVGATTLVRDFRETAGLDGPALAGVTIPTLAVYGGLSHCLPTQEALEALLPACRTARVPGAGHFFPLTRPAEFARLVGGFLQDVETLEGAA